MTCRRLRLWCGSSVQARMAPPPTPHGLPLPACCSRRQLALRHRCQQRPHPRDQPRGAAQGWGHHQARPQVHFQARHACRCCMAAAASPALAGPGHGAPASAVVPASSPLKSTHGLARLHRCRLRYHHLKLLVPGPRTDVQQLARKIGACVTATGNTPQPLLPHAQPMPGEGGAQQAAVGVATGRASCWGGMVQ